MLDEPQRIVSGQFVTPSKLAFARKLRREMTPQERTLWERLRDKRLRGWKFRRQQVIDGYIADFFCATVGVVLELDGAVHHDQEQYDAHRDRALAARRLIVMRIQNDRIERELETVLAEVVGLCEARRPHPPAPSPFRRGGVQADHAVGDATLVLKTVEREPNRDVPLNTPSPERGGGRGVGSST